MPWNANKTQKTCEKKHLSTKPMQKTRKMQKNAQNMQSKSKTNAIKNVLVCAFAFVLLCICVFLRLFFLHFLCVSLRKRTKMKKHAQKTHKQWKKQCKKIAQNGVWKLVVHVHVFLHVFLFLNCCSAFFCFFFWLPFSLFLLFDTHSFWPAALLPFYAVLLHFLVILCECGFAVFLLFLWILEISELGCKVHHNTNNCGNCAHYREVGS